LDQKNEGEAKVWILGMPGTSGSMEEVHAVQEEHTVSEVR
jgi:hypothetical protein